MKIHSDPQIEALKQEQSKARQKTAQNGAFGDVLSQEVGRSAAQGGPSKAGPPPGGPHAVNPLLRAEHVSPVGRTEKAEQEVMRSVENVLSRWENYAAHLGSPMGSMKTAYGELEAISGEVKRIKSEHPGLSENHPGLNDIVNELEVLSASEQFKFNRGDYL